MRGRSMTRPSLLQLDPTIKDRIVRYIAAGAYEWVAALASGISERTFFRWMQMGEKDDLKGRNSPYRRFWQEIRVAYAEARVRNEIKISQADPAKWLTIGPGKSKPGRPGWTEIVEVQTPEGGEFKITHKMEDIDQLGRVLDILEDAGAIPPPPSAGKRSRKAS